MGGVVQLIQIVVTTALWYVFMKVACKAADEKAAFVKQGEEYVE